MSAKMNREYESIRRRLTTAIHANVGKAMSDANLLRDLLQEEEGELNAGWTSVFHLCQQLRDAVYEAMKA